MQISSGYSLSGIATAYSSPSRNQRSVPSPARSFDTVSISEEAKVAYKNARSQTGGMDSAQLEAKLTTFFNMYHVGPDFPVNKNISFDHDFSGELLPENKVLKENIEHQIDKILANHTIDDGPVPQELLDQWMPLAHKLDAIAALGKSMVLDETTLATASGYLQKLDAAWSEMVQDDDSLSGQFHSATHAWKKQPLSEEELREKIEKKKEELNAG
ncbi:MAG: hypothetical protein HDQ89_09830 [Desulfovibrio sp.]|nr:hypothetical protein [Desulfovibrio sp.]